MIFKEEAMKNKIVIIGAGYAGVLTAKKLAKKFKKNDDLSITIIDKNPFHTMLTELHEVAANRVDEDSIIMSLKKIFAGRKVDVVLDTVKSIDFNKNMIDGAKGKYDYDYLVVAAGSKPTYFGTPGAEEFSHKFWSYKDAVDLKDHIHDSFRKAACETNLDEKKKLLTFYIVGAGFTGVELAGEIAEYVPFLCEKYEIDRELVTICDVDMLSRPVPMLPEKLSDKVERRLTRMGVTVMLNTGVVAIGPDFIETKIGDTVSHHISGTVVWAAGIEGSDITNEAAKTLESVKRGRIKVDSYLRSPSNDHVYIVGDNMFYIPEGEERPVPQMVENCEQSAATAAKNIYSAITGDGEMSHYKPAFHGVMVSVGGRYGVARVGFPNRMFNLPSFLAMLSKHFINIVYFIQVLGWNKIFSYVKHEFFTIRNCRSFLGGHFSNRTPSFLLVALRVWLGAVWVFEGVMKITEGWFMAPKLTAFFTGANSWYSSILKIGADGVSSATQQGAQAATDAVTAATGAAQGAAPAAAAAVGSAILNFNFLGLVKVIFVTGKTIATSTLGDYAFKLDIPLMNWFVNHVILSNNSIQMFMQVFIVVAEILIGLALIGGLFTTPAAAFSLVLEFMFVCTTGLYLDTFWMIFAGIAVLIGAGRIFGLDYYFMPYLKKQWKKLPFVRRLYIYND
jgi:NADH:ubiquinone reductase (H+-translocating)